MPAFSPAELERLAHAGRVTPVVRRARVPLDAPTVTVVVDGWFRIFRNAAFVRDVTLLLAGPGEVLAPGSVFGDRSSESGAEAITDGRLVVLSREGLDARDEAGAAFYGALAASLARRTLRIERRLEAFSRAGVEARVASALLELAEDAGVRVPGGVRLELPLSQEHLAGLAGTTRESCSSAVAAFARRGLVRGKRLRGLVLTSAEGLAEVAAVDFRGV